MGSGQGWGQDRDVPAQGWGQDRDVPAPAPRWPWWALPSHCCPQRQEVTPARLCRSSGAVQTPGPAEPILVPSGSQFLTPGLGDAAPPVLHIQLCSLSALGLPWAVPVSQCLQGQCCPCPGCGQTVQCLPAGEGRFVPVSASAMFIPIDLHPWLQGWNVPGAGLALASCCSSQAAPAPQPPSAAPSLAQPWAPCAVP